MKKRVGSGCGNKSVGASGGCPPKAVSQDDYGCGKLRIGGRFKTLREIVTDYLKNIKCCEEAYLEDFRDMPSFAKCVKAAALARSSNDRKFKHQWRIPNDVLEKAHKRLQRVNLRRARSFDALYDLVSEAIRDIEGIGPLTVYDTAHRIGACRGLSPKCVYVHAGVAKGAKALGLNPVHGKLALDQIPKELRKLRPEQIEDCLCIYKDHFRPDMR